MDSEKYWWKRAKIYELYIDKFAGTIGALADGLGYFEALGVNTLHLLPHYPSPMIDGGYDVTDYRGVRPELGSVEDFAALVSRAHERGLRILIDWPLNHTSTQHPWFAEARLSRDNPKRDFYLWSEKPDKFLEAPNAFPDMKASNWIYNPPTDDHYFATFYPEQADLNWDNPDVFAEIVGAMDFWIELGVDGFRLDAVPHLVKRDGTDCRGLPETHAILKRIRAHIEVNHPEVILVAEAHNTLPLTKAYFGAGDECHMAYNFVLAAETWLALATSDRGRLDACAEESRDIPENCQWITFLRNHDEISFDTAMDPEERRILMDFLDPDRRYVMKKAGLTSVRVATVFSGKRDGIREAFSLLFSMPGAPDIYYGDEIGMQNLDPEEGVLDTRKFVRGPFDRAAAAAAVQDPGSIFNEVARMLRQTNPSPGNDAAKSGM
ncbi:MAG TPA: alpha-amylase family glycosyl hydrolase [Candidatus Paceibacterota bacterium]|nr:alpha-amylase family glycosyl hydrolase [Candidatus Paceibacterota bacterium]